VSCIKSDGHDFFRKVFGAKRYERHFKNDFNFYNALQHAHKVTKTTPSEHDQYVACSPYLHGRISKQHLSERYGESNIHTVYASEKENTVCYILTTNEIGDDIILNAKIRYI
jgi:hypothetical protein